MKLLVTIDCKWLSENVSNLFVVMRMLSKDLGRDETVGEEETTEVVEFSTHNQCLDSSSLKMSWFKSFSSS